MLVGTGNLHLIQSDMRISKNCNSDLFGSVPLVIIKKNVCSTKTAWPIDSNESSFLESLVTLARKKSCETAALHFPIIVAHIEREKFKKENIILDVLCTEGRSLFDVKTLHMALMGFNQQLISLNEIKRQASILRLNNSPDTER